jgi:hypothetical protein
LHEREGFWGRLFTVKFEVLRHLPSSLLSISDLPSSLSIGADLAKKK